MSNGCGFLFRILFELLHAKTQDAFARCAFHKFLGSHREINISPKRKLALRATKTAEEVTKYTSRRDR